MRNSKRRMAAMALAGMMLAAAVQTNTGGQMAPTDRAANRDKSGTTGVQNESRDSQLSVGSAVAKHGSSAAERAGFSDRSPAAGSRLW